RKRKQPVTVLLKALGWTNDMILERFGRYETMRATLEKDHTSGQEDALLDIYRKLRPGEPPTKESAQALLENLYFNPKRYDLAKVGRYKVNKKLGLDIDINQGTLTEEDIVAVIEYLVRLHAGETSMPGANGDVPVEIDDIDHFGNRRRSEEHTSELQSRENLVCRLLLEKKKKKTTNTLQKNRIRNLQ